MAIDHGSAVRPSTELADAAFAVETDLAHSYIRLFGELDEETGALVRCVLDSQMAQGHLDVCLDLSGLTFFDLRGFAALCDARRRLTEHGGRLRILEAGALFRRVADLWGVPDMVDDWQAEPPGHLPQSTGPVHGVGGAPSS